ncbi:MAG TPA: hypothetical protein VHO84_12235 [Syntrophorhabdaceae bacterium]|nr:hypothetical protein [Syntrophorhabdaceae bacterium]
MTEMKPEDKCVYCGKSDMVHDIRVGQTAEVGEIGLTYSKSIIHVTEPLCADLCMSCGSVRLYVRRTDRKWLIRKPKL